MRKSIFVRYFTVITSIILICLTILGTLAHFLCRAVLG